MEHLTETKESVIALAKDKKTRTQGIALMLLINVLTTDTKLMEMDAKATRMRETGEPGDVTNDALRFMIWSIDNMRELLTVFHEMHEDGVKGVGYDVLSELFDALGMREALDDAIKGESAA